MINKLVVENLKHRPIRTMLSVVVIGVQVTMVLTLVGVSRGMLQDTAQRARGAGADILIRAPGSSIIGLSTDFSAKILPFVAKLPHVALVSGTVVQAIGGIDTVTGVDLPTFTAMSGGFRYLEGGPFSKPDDIIVDEYYAKQHHQRAGDKVTVLGRDWHICGVIEQGKLARLLLPISLLQDLTAKTDKLTVIYVKVDEPANVKPVIAELNDKLKDYKVYSIEEYASLFSVANVPALKEFIGVIIGLGVFIGFLVVFLSMYTAVLERTREIGVLKALGASPGFIMNMLLRETVVLAIGGTIIGVLLTYGSRWLIMTLVPTMVQVIVPDWWPIAGAIALVGAVIGAIYPGLRAARQNAIEALAYD